MNKQIPTISVSELKRRLRAASNCDALATEQVWLRTFTYTVDWQDAVDLAKYDNGRGDHVFVLFTAGGAAFIKGFDHESAVSPHSRDVFGTWSGLYHGLPESFGGLLKNEIFEAEEATFCCWSEDGERWNTGTADIPPDLDDGSGWMLYAIQKDASQYAEWAKSYYGENFELIGIDRIVTEFHSGETSKAGLNK